MIKLSVVIITFNEEKNIARCIDSILSVADDVVVVDSFSTDKTKEICLSKGVRFLEHEFEGYAQQKNFGNEQARYSYILSVDADECLSDELKQSIIAVKENWEYDCFEMNRLNNYCGQWIRHGLWYPDKKIRLWNKEKGRWTGDYIHEKLTMQAGSSHSFLKGDLLHYTVDAVESHQKQIEKFADKASLEMYRENRKAFMPLVAFKSLFTFIKGFIIKAGFLDGKYGFIINYQAARYVWLKYSKLQKRQKQSCCD